ncbi:MAG: filamentous hemagglutinin family protein [Rhodocyclaceae bacterium]
MALALTAGTMTMAHAQHAFSPAWFAAKGATRGAATQNGRLPNGMPANVFSAPQQQSQAARERLQRSISNLGLVAQTIAAQQAAQAAAREAAKNRPGTVPDGLTEGGLKVDNNSLTAGWLGAKAPVQSQVAGRTHVAIEQTADKAILNWETFNVGRNTTVEFAQQADWAVLNRVNDPLARPSQILGQIKADGTVLIVNRNGVIFNGTSQVDTRNLVAAAAHIADEQFRERGLYVDANGTQPTFTAAAGKIEVQAGAQITTAAAASSTSAGGYVLLLGSEVSNAGGIATARGQTTLAAGDSFYIRKGVGTAGNVDATTAGNEVSTARVAGSKSGTVINTGLITAATGDITLTGHDVTQAGVAVVSTSSSQRGTIHLSTRASDTTGTVTLAEGSITAALLTDSATTALDSQRDAALERLGISPTNNATGVFDNLSTVTDRRDLSRIEIVSGNTVAFEGDSTTLATGGEIAVSARQRTLVDAEARLDVSGAVGVSVAMEANNLKINAQGNEQRDAPTSRDGKSLNNLDLWIDRRELVYVPAGTHGYATDRWYTAGGLLEVSGYLATSGHTVGEWMAQGGTVTVTGNDLVTRAGSSINLSGGTLNVATGYINQSWLKGADGKLYEVSSAPGDMLYTGLYRGYESASKRWQNTEYFNNPLIGASRRLENGYTVGRDAGKLVVATSNAVLEGSIVSDVYQGPRQTQAAQAGLDGYYQSQTAVARGGQLVIGQYTPIYDAEAKLLRYALDARIKNVEWGDFGVGQADAVQLNDAVAQDRQGTLQLDSAHLNAQGLSAVRIAASEAIDVDAALVVAPGGEIVLYAPQVDVQADLTAHSGVIQLGNVLKQPIVTTASGKTVVTVGDRSLAVPAGTAGGVQVHDGVTLDASGLTTDLREVPAGSDAAVAHVDGGTVSIRSTDSVTLAKGALIDVSSGATVEADGGVTGGVGGTVQLGAGLVSTNAGNAAAVLAFDGAIKGYGVKGGGRLEIESASAVTVGGSPLKTNGQLAKGESVFVDLVLAEDVTVRAGELLPADYQYTSTRAKPGETFGAAPNLAGLVLASKWVLPYASGKDITLGVYIVNYRLPGETATRQLQVLPQVYANGAKYELPAGTTIVSVGLPLNIPVQYVVPADVFPNGVPVAQHLRTAQAGTSLSFDVVIAKGAIIEAGFVAPRDIAVESLTTLDPGLFQSGFADYQVRGHNGLWVADGVALDVTQPVLAVDLSRPSISSAALSPWLPDLYQEDAKARQLSPREGASIALAAGADGGGRGALYIGQGAHITVDPGQSIALSSRDGMSVDGTLTAKGGDISLIGPQTGGAGRSLEEGGSVADGTASDRAIVLGQHAVLDASAMSHIATDSLGRSYGLLTAGGNVVIGGTLQESGGRAIASDAFVVMRQGSVIDVSGGSAAWDVDGTGVRQVVSDGGNIGIASLRGIYLDGSLRAHAGGAGAAGGRLSVALEAPNYIDSQTVRLDDNVLALRDLRLTQQRGAAADTLAYGHAALGVDQVQEGGFSSLTLYSNGAVSFGGDVDLTMARELRIYSGALTVADGVDPAIAVALKAPYLLLAGASDQGPSADGYVRPAFQAGVSTLPSRATLSASADLLDVKGEVTLGLNDSIRNTRIERAGFEHVNLISAGDIRFTKGGVQSGNSLDAELNSAGSILLRAAQVYPATGVAARVLAGRATQSTYDPADSLVVERYDAQAATPAVPYSVFGSLTLGAARIEQNGVIRAPLGAITLGTEAGTLGATKLLTLDAGSLTSVSAAGLVMPYGGTADGVNYQYLGKNVSLVGVGAGPGITLSGQDVAVGEGAALDLSGGGELRGAGFVSGRGGSTDARFHPLIQTGGDGLLLPGLQTHPVYAIVPGYGSQYAPADASGALDPLMGQQVTLRSGEVPGLAAGTYTLLPSSYALLPGAFRVELNGLASVSSATRVIAMRNGSYAVSGTLGVANTGIADSLSRQFIITPADALRSYSQYIETSYSDFILSQAALNGSVRAVLPADAKTLAIRLPSSADSSFSFAGKADFTPAKDGYGGTASLVTSDGNVGSGAIEILGAGATATAGFKGVSVYARDLDALGAARLSIGGNWLSTYGKSATGVDRSNFLLLNRQTGSIVLRSGATLHAPEVFLLAANPSTGITLEAGAGIDTIGAGKVAYDSSAGYVYQPGSAAVLAASNGWINMLAPEATDSTYSGSGAIAVGVCAAACPQGTELYSEGTLLAATLSCFELDDAVRYGTRNLVLAVGTINAGTPTELAEAAARGALTSGLALNQTTLDRLLQGDTAHGAPALERLVLTAGESFNLFGTVTLDTTDAATGQSRLANLVLSTPAIYGYGDADDVASISVGKLTWAGHGGSAPTPVAGGRGTGSGSLRVAADVIEFGYDASAQPNGIDDHARYILGFADVALTATNRVTANQKGSLFVYQAQTAAADGLHYTGGNLSLTAPVVTGAGGSVNRITAGGALQLVAPPSGAAQAADITLAKGIETGAELSLNGASVRIDTTVALPSGKLTATATGDIALGDAAYLDLSGREITLYDAHRYSWGGDVALSSGAGNVTQAAGAIIDVSAQNNHAGLLSVAALGEGAGRVDLQGTLRGGASGHYDAGGTSVPYRAGGVDIRAQHLGDGGSLTDEFAALNTALNEGGLTGQRSFQLKQGDLVIGDTLRANEIKVSLDKGHLTVAGKVDASGEQVGSIRLAANNGVTLTRAAHLDAHGTLLRVDSYGQIIDAPNRAMVELDAGHGTLVLAEGARIDLRYGTDDPRYAARPALQAAAQARGALGTLDLYAPRIDAAGQADTAAAATYGDIAIDARGRLDILGARSIAVYGRQVYKDAPYGSDAAASGRPYQLITQAWLKGKHDEAEDFVDAALRNTNLLTGKLAGLHNSTYDDVLHLRPAIEVVSKTPDGDLVVSGDLDLSGFRYASLNPHNQKTAAYGSGEVGMLTLRAGGDLSIYGSINDGFAPPPATPDDEGWMLTPGVQAFGGDVVVPVAGVTLAAGTKYPAGKTLNYAITASNVTLPSGTLLPTRVALDSAVTLPAGTVLAADVLAANGSVLLAAGSVVGRAGMTLPGGAQLQAGTRLPVALTLARLTWPKGVQLPVNMVQAGALTLPVGALIASGTDVVLPDGALFVDLRPKDAQGKAMTRGNWAVAPMLPAGSQSWSMRLVAGADTAAADSRATRPGGGNVILADTHYTAQRQWKTTGGAVWYWSDGNYYGTPGTPVEDWALDPSWNVCEMEAGQCVKVSWVWADGNYYGTPGMPVDAWALDPSWNVCEMEAGQCVAVGGPGETVLVAVVPQAPVFSVARTGTGDLDVATGGDLSMQSPFGVYTAGTQSLLGDAALDAAYNQARGRAASGNTVLGGGAGEQAPAYEALVTGSGSLYQAWYPDGGGNLRLSVGGDLTGDSWGSGTDLASASSSVGNWLWRQGTGSEGGIGDVPTAWWINFGTYAYEPASTRPNWPTVAGFTGFGTLGGGDVDVRVEGDAGVISRRSTSLVSSVDTKSARSQGVVLAVGSSGRVAADGSIVLTGGGDLDVRIGGGWNSHLDARLNTPSRQIAQTHELYGALINLRGAVDMAAGQVGTVELFYGRGGGDASQDTREVRSPDPFTSSTSRATGGLMVMPGDATVNVASRGDLVLGGTGDAGLVDTRHYTAYTSPQGNGQAGRSWFSLWTDATAARLMAAGGNLAFDTRAGEALASSAYIGDYTSNGGWFMLPGTVSATAALGSIYYGTSAAYHTGYVTNVAGLLQTPQGERRIELLAGDSLYGGGYAIASPGADASIMATVFKPAFAGFDADKKMIVSNTSVYAPAPDTNRYPLLAFGINSVGQDAGTAATPSAPSRFYAVNGDVIGLRTGSTLEFLNFDVRAGQTDYVAAGPVVVRAGRDIVYTGTRANETPLDLNGLASDASAAKARGNLIVHAHPNDISLIEAGRDILYATFDVAGPGALEISAGRNIVQNDLASLSSVGPVVAGDDRRGADIVVQAGMGAQGAHYASFLDAYLNPANRAVPGTPLADQTGKVAKTYEDELIAWLKARHGFTGSADEARGFFAGLTPEQQGIFARQVFFAELRAGGREYNDAEGPRFGSYLRGRHAIATLFPERDAQGQTIARSGDLLIYGGAGIHTNLGGDIQVLTPGGAQTYGVEGAAPPATAGLVTRGDGDIQLYSLDSILLGQSRIMTTFGGDILAWSAQGDINAGRGARTTVVYTPPRRLYDDAGNVTISPNVPSTGAGIATLDPIPEVPPGDVDLIAPLGTVDAGEAGIRVSGNVNVAALHVLNAEGIKAKGEATGLPAIAAVNVAALSNASSATASAATAAQDVMQRERAAARQNMPSIFTVRVIGFGNEPAEDAKDASPTGASLQSGMQTGAGRSGPVQVIGLGRDIDADQWAHLTSEERARLIEDR